MGSRVWFRMLALIGGFLLASSALANEFWVGPIQFRGANSYSDGGLWSVTYTAYNTDGAHSYNVRLYETSQHDAKWSLQSDWVVIHPYQSINMGWTSAADGFTFAMVGWECDVQGEENPVQDAVPAQQAPAAAVPAAAPANTGWLTFAPDQDEFSVLIPGTPAVVREHSWAFCNAASTLCYKLKYISLGKASKTQALANAKMKVLENEDATEISAKPMKARLDMKAKAKPIDGIPCYVDARCLILHGRLYTLVYKSTKPNFDQDSEDTFFNSFKINEAAIAQKEQAEKDEAAKEAQARADQKARVAEEKRQAVIAQKTKVATDKLQDKAVKDLLDDN